MAFTPKTITKELDFANLANHNTNNSAIKTELDAHDAHIAAQTAHGSTSVATAGKIVQRDSSGRAKVAAPSASDDIARKAEVDAVQTALDTHVSDANVHLSEEDRTKFTGVKPGAEPNQNAFATINNVVAATPSDSLTFEGGTGITVTTNPTTKKVTVTATGEATPGAHGSSHDNDGADPIPELVALRSEFDALAPAVTAQLADIANPPRAQYSSNIDKVCTTFQWEAPNWNVKIYDTESFIDQTDPTTVVINKSGIYLIQAQVSFAANVLGQRNIRITKNNDTATLGYSSNNATANTTRINVATTAFLNAGETVKVLAYQDTNADLAFVTAGGMLLSLTMLCPP